MAFLRRLRTPGDFSQGTVGSPRPDCKIEMVAAHGRGEGGSRSVAAFRGVAQKPGCGPAALCRVFNALGRF